MAEKCQAEQILNNTALLIYCHLIRIIAYTNERFQILSRDLQCLFINWFARHWWRIADRFIGLLCHAMPCLPALSDPAYGLALMVRPRLIAIA